MNGIVSVGDGVQGVDVGIADECETTYQQRIARENSSRDLLVWGNGVQGVDVVIDDECETTCQQRIARENSSKDLVRGTIT